MFGNKKSTPLKFFKQGVGAGSGKTHRLSTEKKSGAPTPAPYFKS